MERCHPGTGPFESFAKGGVEANGPDPVVEQADPEAALGALDFGTTLALHLCCEPQ